MVVGAVGYEGVCRIPLALQDSELAVLRPLLLRADEMPDAGSIAIQVAAVDARGRVSPASTIELPVVQAVTGALQVNLSWDTRTDLDLHVVEPGGCEAYYGNRICESGGGIDLDSNPACAIDGVQAENAAWPDDALQPGPYSVRVSFWSDCSDVGASFQVTLRYCGLVDVVAGGFEPGADTHGGAGSGVEVAVVDPMACPSLLRGRVRYVASESGPSSWARRTRRELRGANVELRDAVGLVRTQTMTTARGEFELVLPADAEAGWTLAVTTAAGAAGAAISVIDAGEEGAPHDIEMPLTDAMIAGPVGNADVDIDGSAAASFEAFDVAAHGRARLLALAGGSLPPQRLRVARDSRPVSPIRVLEEVALQAFEHRLGRTPAESAGLGARREPADAFRAGAARFLARDLAGQST